MFVFLDNNTVLYEMLDGQAIAITSIQQVSLLST